MGKAVFDVRLAYNYGSSRCLQHLLMIGLYDAIDQKRPLAARPLVSANAQRRHWPLDQIPVHAGWPVSDVRSQVMITRGDFRGLDTRRLDRVSAWSIHVVPRWHIDILSDSGTPSLDKRSPKLASLGITRHQLCTPLTPWHRLSIRGSTWTDTLWCSRPTWRGRLISDLFVWILILAWRRPKSRNQHVRDLSVSQMNYDPALTSCCMG